MLVRFAAASLLLVACVPDSTEDPGPTPVAHQLDVAKLSPEARARVIRAALTDLAAAKWVGRQLQWNWAPCMTATNDGNGTLSITGQGCNGFTGSLDVINNETYRFHGVRLADQDIELEGTLVEHFSATSFFEGVGITITRGGIAVRSAYETDEAGPQAGATVELDGDGAQFTTDATSVTFTTFDPAIAPFTFTHDGTCGADPITGDPICLWNTEPTEFTTGTFRKLERVCDGNDATLRFISASADPVTAVIEGLHISIGTGAYDAATQLYAFETSDGDCANPHVFSSYQVSQPPAYRAELMIAPHLVWSY